MAKRQVALVQDPDSSRIFIIDVNTKNPLGFRHTLTGAENLCQERELSVVLEQIRL